MNIQTIPRKDKDVKRAFQPKLDYLLLADYSQIEYRLFAWYMAMQVDDWRGVEAYHAEVDFHEAQARRIHEAMGWEYTGEDSQRQVGKTSNFAAVYSGGIPTIQRQLGCSKGTARHIADAFHEDNPGLGRWKWEGRGFTDPDPLSLNGQLVATHLERGYVRTLWGRHLHAESGEERKLLNKLIQGGAADLIKKSKVNLADELDGNYRSHLVNSVHDELTVDVAEDELEALSLLLPRVMCDEPQLTEVLPITVDMKLSSTNWAEAEEYSV
jgi:DNA polymerase I